MQLVFIGAPGSGKGTQAKRLCQELGYNHASTGDLLRAEAAKHNDFGMKIKKIIDVGNLVDDELVLELLKKNCDVSTAKYIFDGFPRNVEQCKMLTDSVLGSSPYKVLYFSVDIEIIVERIVNRRIAPQSGKIYNLLTNPPLKEGICDVSGEDIIHRDDDQRSVVESRLKIYENSIELMKNYYESEKCLSEIDANEHPDVIFKKIIGLIK